MTPLGRTRLPFGPTSRQPGVPSISPESRTGSVEAQADRVGEGQLHLAERPARAEDADAGDHPLPGADHRDRLVGREVGRLVQRLHRRQLIARAEEDVDVRLRQVAVPGRDVGDDVGAIGLAVGGPRARRPIPELLADDRPDQLFDPIAGNGGAHASVLGPTVRGTPSTAPFFDSASRGARWISHPLGFQDGAIIVGQAGIDHHVVDRVESAEMRQGQAAELRAVGDDDHLLPALHHLTLGLDQQQVRVVDAVGHDPPRAEDRLADPDALHHGDRQRPERDAGPRIDVAADQDEVVLLAGWPAAARSAGCWSPPGWASPTRPAPPPASSSRRRARPCPRPPGARRWPGRSHASRRRPSSCARRRRASPGPRRSRPPRRASA